MGWEKHIQKIRLEHESVDAEQVFATFVSRLVRRASVHNPAFEKQKQKKNRLPGELSSDDESVIGEQTIHFEYSVDAAGNPIEFDGEDVVGNNRTAKSRDKQKRTTGLPPLSLNSYVLFEPDDGDEQKIYVVQVLALNPEPDNPETWVQNNNRKWHYKGGWWELVDPHVAGHIRKALRSKAICDVLAAGKEDEFDLQNPAVVARLEKGPKQWMIQFMDRDAWQCKTMMENVEMNGKKKIKDRKFNMRVLKLLDQKYPHLKLLTEEPRFDAVADPGLVAGSSADQPSKKRKAGEIGTKQESAPRVHSSDSEPDCDMRPSADASETTTKSASAAAYAGLQTGNLQLVPIDKSKRRHLVTADRVSQKGNKHLAAAFERATGSRTHREPSEVSDTDEREEDRYREPSDTVDRFMLQSLQAFEDSLAAEQQCAAAGGGGSAASGGGSSSHGRRKYTPSQCTILAIGK